LGLRDEAANAIDRPNTIWIRRRNVCESKDRDRWLADGEGRCGGDGRDQAFVAFSGLRQFGRKTRRSGMHLGDMVGDETHDALAVFHRQWCR
jgi:hypothetical protein